MISQNGPDTTFILGAEASGGGNGDDAVRCVYMTDGSLSGFTLTSGHTRIAGDSYNDRSGGGVNMLGGVVSNCVVVGNSANTKMGKTSVFLAT